MTKETTPMIMTTMEVALATAIATSTVILVRPRWSMNRTITTKAKLGWSQRSLVLLMSPSTSTVTTTAAPRTIPQRLKDNMCTVPPLLATTVWMITNGTTRTPIINSWDVDCHGQKLVSPIVEEDQYHKDYGGFPDDADMAVPKVVD